MRKLLRMSCKTSTDETLITNPNAEFQANPETVNSAVEVKPDAPKF